MHILSFLRPCLLLTMLVTTSSSSPLLAPSNSPPSPPHRPRALHPSTLSNSAAFTMGPYKVFMLKTIAILPLQTASAEMRDFFTVVAQAGSVQKLAGRVTSSYSFDLGAIAMDLSTMPLTVGGTPPALDWDLVMWIGSQLLDMAKLGWTEHFAAVFVDATTRAQTFVTLQVVQAGLATIGYVDPATGGAVVPAIEYFGGSR